MSPVKGKCMQMCPKEEITLWVYLILDTEHDTSS
jgi:hypothetical protein